MENYNSSMKISQIKNDMRLTMMKEIEDFLKTKYKVVGKVESNEIAVVMGTYFDEDECPYDTTVTIKVTAKPFYSKDSYVKENGETSREITFYDPAQKIEDYAKGVEA